MAIKLWYLTATRVNGWRTLDETGIPSVNSVDGWILGKGGSINVTSAYYADVKRAASTFAGTTAPDGTLDSTNNDALRTTFPITGDFAAGQWIFNAILRPTVPDNHKVAAVLRLFRGSNGNGVGAVQVTTAQQTGATSAAMSSAASDYASQVLFTLPLLSLAGEYLWLQLALKRVVKGSAAGNDCVFRTGFSSVMGTRLLSPNFTAPPLTASAAEGSASAADAPSVVSMGYGVAVAEGAGGAADSPAATLTTNAEVAEGSATGNDVSDAALVSGTPRIGRVAWVRMVAPREAAQSASVIEGGPTALDTCDAKFALAASIAEGSQTAADTIIAHSSLYAELAEGSPIATETYEASANVVTNAVIAEGGLTAHELVSSLFDAAQAFQLEGEETALDLCEAVVVQPAMCAEGGPTAQDTITTGNVMNVLVFEGSQTAQDFPDTAGQGFNATVAEGAQSAQDFPDFAGNVLGEAVIVEGEDSAADFQEALGERNAFMVEGEATAEDTCSASVVAEAVVEEGGDTAEDESEAAPEWAVSVEEGADTANDLIVCDLGDRHAERERRYLPAITDPRYAVVARTARELTLPREVVIAQPERGEIFEDAPAKDSKFVPENVPDPLFEDE